MSRAYRIKVRESQNRVVKAKDHVSTQLEILSILPPEQMADLLARALEERGFERCGDQLSREQDGVVIVVDAQTGTVSVHSEEERAVQVEGVLDGYAGDQDGAGAKRAREALKKELHKKLDQQTSGHEAKLQTEVTDRLEAALGELRKELDQVVNRVTAEALKRKAAQLGQIKELTEDPQTGSMTIVLEV
jgi:hypothetical protein